ncbi:protein-disulfide reductase DsbD family protein [Limobrevibacterium gyesilva]|uniref:Protein-disulfide reductase DsbD family protein n=1 Tax=Limobrevibacterium gyesilva TaxID=2991712 RepID=A0AA41YRU2_9PROT|nr:protein-disulfide reductase DsbD domain-containing protein [Limobrevibacterium gyesilva]MCW3477536.1 protein-disulfide reductase DsbD family protein [Limobrevibacterium gyesilva]
MARNLPLGRRIQGCARLLLGAIAIIAWPGGSPWAATGPWASGETVRTRLLTATDATGQDSDIHAGLQVSLNEGWDTYWRSPGDAGAPPTVDWSGSANVASVDWRWPAPTRFTLFGLETFGYLHEVVFPLTVHPERPGEPVALRGKLDILVCSTICVPKSLDLSRDLPAGAATADPEAANLIARYEARVPVDGPRSGLFVDGVEVEPGNPGSLKVRISSRDPLSTRADVIVESPRWSFGKPVFSLGADGRTATATLPLTAGPEAVTMPGADVTVTLEDGPRASETAASVKAGAARGQGRLDGLLPFLGVAFLGGLILNLMPCVLPVLGLKLMAVLRHQGRARRQIRLGFLATAAGVVASMLAVGAVLAGLKAAGLAVGWGMQFQQPVFLVLMAGTLVVFAANLADLYEFALPPRLATALGEADGDGVGGGFLAGAFTTVLATPCSAPFVGTAIAFALARGTGEILTIFGALGIGLAAPHFLVAAVPGLVRLLPRPGRWMLALRRMLATALAGTALWLLIVLAAQTSWQAAASAAVALAVLAAALALRAQIGAIAAAAMAAVALLGAVAAPAVLRAPLLRTATTTWAPFDEAGIRKLVAEGKTVFVDVTAEWCVNCKANEVLVLGRSEVASALREPGVVAMRADWTRPDQRITDYLGRYSRFGIPFNAVYGPGAPRGIVLSEVLTRDAVLDALRRARGNGKVSFR